MLRQRRHISLPVSYMAATGALLDEPVRRRAAYAAMERNSGNPVLCERALHIAILEIRATRDRLCETRAERTKKCRRRTLSLCNLK